jgi:hypothetical protein
MLIHRNRLAGFAFLLLVMPSSVALGQIVPAIYPPPPNLPETLARTADGRATVRAVRLTAPLQLDGRLDEAVYFEILPADGLIQADPKENMPFTERHETWVFFDDSAIYVSMRCWESRPDRMIANEMRRDHGGLAQNDHVSFTLDTFLDRRNAVSLTVSASGGRMDGQFSDERLYNGDWNPVWDSAVSRFEGGWSVEMAVPFKSLRYGPGREQVWGFNVRRLSRWKNEMAHLTAIPRALALRGMFIQSLAGTLVGVEAPPPAMNLEIKPYITGNLISDRTARPPVSNDPGGEVGIDVKYGLGRSLTTDFTYNTDFAQVEADEQQVNLTRFSLFFPEKREFFLENSGTFAFGGAGTFGAASGDTPTIFYSRRIGLNLGRPLPIDGGGRLTGRFGRFSLGVISIQTGEEPVSGSPSTNFSVLRLKRDILRKSNIGVMVTRRSVGERHPGSNETYGVDGAFGFYDNLTVNTYWARTRTRGLGGDNTSYRGQINYAGDRYGLQLEQLSVGHDFNPDMGFVRRLDTRRSFAQARFSPRPTKSVVRRYSFVMSGTYIENGARRIDAREVDGSFAVEFQTGDRFSLSYDRTFEFLPTAFRIATGVEVPTGGYNYESGRVSYSFGQQRPISGSLSAEHGTFYDGHRTTFAVGGGRVELTPQFSAQPTVSVNRVSLPQGAFITTLAGTRTTYTMTPRMFVSALVQYNTSAHSLASNVRLRWEYAPGSELFVVYNDQRDTLAQKEPSLQNRAFIIKINRLLRF